MYFDFKGDWPAYIAIAVFVAFLVFVIVKGHAKHPKDSDNSDVIKK